MKQYRQGDIFLLQVDHTPELEDKIYFSTEGKNESNRTVLAYGEVTGHAHAIHDKHVKLRKASNLNQFFLLVEKDANLSHEEHSTIKLPAGTYQVIRQRYYTPTEIRTVND